MRLLLKMAWKLPNSAASIWIGAAESVLHLFSLMCMHLLPINQVSKSRSWLSTFNILKEKNPVKSLYINITTSINGNLQWSNTASQFSFNKLSCKLAEPRVFAHWDETIFYNFKHLKYTVLQNVSHFFNGRSYRLFYKSVIYTTHREQDQQLWLLLHNIVYLCIAPIWNTNRIWQKIVTM